MTERFDISCHRSGTNGPLPRSGRARSNLGVDTRIMAEPFGEFEGVRLPDLRIRLPEFFTGTKWKPMTQSIDISCWRGAAGRHLPGRGLGGGNIGVYTRILIWPLAGGYCHANLLGESGVQLEAASA